ncbi:hypothetical protein J4413_03645 [Candidatus Woesearchaeota archaeon]|nr:hypothetical protein [Candidatus Woesearchaeota archaeon]
MLSQEELEGEARYLNQAIGSNNRFYDAMNAPDPLDLLEASRTAYYDLTSALISLDRLELHGVSIDPREGCENTDLRSLLESRLIFLVYVAVSEDIDPGMKTKLLQTPWGKKARNPEYTRKLFEGDSAMEEIHEIRKTLDLD